MDIKIALAKEHSKKQCDIIVQYIGINKERFAELMNLFFESEYRIVQRAAWPMSYSVRNHPKLIVPYFKPLIDNLQKKGIPDAVIRNTVRLLQDVEIPKKYPDIISELKLIIKERWEHETSAFHSRAKKILKAQIVSV